MINHASYTTTNLSELTGKACGLIVYRDLPLAVFCRWEGVCGIPLASHAGCRIVGDRPFRAGIHPETVSATIALGITKGMRVVEHPDAQHIRAAMEQAARDGGRVTVYSIDGVKVIVLNL